MPPIRLLVVVSLLGVLCACRQTSAPADNTAPFDVPVHAPPAAAAN